MQRKSPRNVEVAARPATAGTINIAYIVPKDKADETEASFKSHSEWMAKFYEGSTEHLISCYFTKAPEFKAPRVHVLLGQSCRAASASDERWSTRLCLGV